ncbi:hypothetical protein CDL15_Pgr024677 [Punica granatum]|nr:hypothetical protein CDL15_Pgr024677 [Punica granatum]
MVMVAGLGGDQEGTKKREKEEGWKVMVKVTVMAEEKRELGMVLVMVMVTGMSMMMELLATVALDRERENLGGGGVAIGWEANEEKAAMEKKKLVMVKGGMRKRISRVGGVYGMQRIEEG